MLPIWLILAVLRDYSLLVCVAYFALEVTFAFTARCCLTHSRGMITQHTGFGHGLKNWKAAVAIRLSFIKN